MSQADHTKTWTAEMIFGAKIAQTKVRLFGRITVNVLGGILQKGQPTRGKVFSHVWESKARISIFFDNFLS